VQVSIPELVAAARAGQLVGFPTDTVPALAAIPAAAAHIYAAKQRATEKPLILMAATAEDLWPFIQGDIPI
jgi:L-threonylcarbamoyladenylate synthase